MTTAVDETKAIEDPDIIRSGRLSVGGGHELYWVDWGNKAVKNPIFYLHGGPGQGFEAKDFARFDPKKHRVVFHDQRGSNRSTPFASIENNTSQDLVSDINKLRQFLGFDKISLYGFSWGSTLALLYAIENPEEVEKILIGAIYLARKVDADFYLTGGVKSHFPEAWQRFIANVPDENRNDIASYYRKMMTSKKEADRKRFAREWLVYEASIFRLEYDPSKVEAEAHDFASESMAYLEAHYILNDCFIEENYIIKNAHKIANIQTIIVQGRYDFICTPSAAIDLQTALGDKAILHMVISGHARENVSKEVVKAYTTMLW